MAKNVTLTGADDPRIKSALLDGRRFWLNEEQKNVSDQNIKRLKAIPGLQFRVTDPAPSGDDK